jgi:serralysin
MKTRDLPRVAIAFSLCLSFVISSFGTMALDPTFNGTGRVTVAWTEWGEPRGSNAFRIFVQPGGRILVVGSHAHSTPDGPMNGVGWVGLTSSGAIDPGFGSGGRVSNWGALGSSNLTDALMYPDGSTLRVSQHVRIPVGSMTVETVRMTPGGGNDNVFAQNVRIGPCCLGFFSARPVQVALRPDGKVLAHIIDQNEHFLYRVNADGTRDASFGVDGIVKLIFNKFPSNFGVVEMLPTSDGKTLIVGHYGASGFFFLARLTNTGLWDKSFGRAGLHQLEFAPGVPGATGGVRGMIHQPDGNILISGTVVVDGNQKLWMTRLRPNGRRDSTFGTSGVVIHDVTPGEIQAGGPVVLSDDGKIRMVGSIGNPWDFLVTRFSANGAYEEHIRFGFTAGFNSTGSDIGLQPDGKIVVAGSTRNPNQAIAGNVYAIARITE